MTTHHPTGGSVPFWLGALLALSAASPSADEARVVLYECNKNGVVTFSDQPCGTREERVEVEYDRTDSAREGAAARNEEAQVDRVAEAELLNTEILNAQRQLSDLENERDMRIAELDQQDFAGSEGLDQNAWQNSMDEKIREVATRYQNRIDVARARLAELEGRRAALPPSQP